MPFQYERLKWHLPKEYNRRVKLSDIDKETIKQLYQQGKESINGLARLYSVNKRLIQFILFPERQTRNKELRAIRGGSKRYYNREKNRLAEKDTRNYKQKIYLKLKGETNG